MLGTAVVYGTDVFCAVVQRPALAVVDDRALVAVMGDVHHHADRRMRVPGVLGAVAAIASAALFAVAGQWPQTITAFCVVAILLAWIVLYARISAPINGDGRAFLALGENLKQQLGAAPVELRFSWPVPSVEALRGLNRR